MSTSHVAARYGVSWHLVYQAEHHALQRWQATRSLLPLTMVGIDEKYLGRRNKLEDKYVTIVSDPRNGEPIWIGFGRSEATVRSCLQTLTAERKANLVLVAMDMHGPFKAAIRNDPDLKRVAVVHDPFHVMKRGGDAIDELRRQVFFHGGEQMRALGRGKRWLFKRAWEKCTPAQREHPNRRPARRVSWDAPLDPEMHPA